MFSNNHAKFHAFITKVNNSALFWLLAARLGIKKRSVIASLETRFDQDSHNLRKFPQIYDISMGGISHNEDAFFQVRSCVFVGYVSHIMS